jgi:hypothetical protein
MGDPDTTSSGKLRLHIALFSTTTVPTAPLPTVTRPPTRIVSTAPPMSPSTEATIHSDSTVTRCADDTAHTAQQTSTLSRAQSTAALSTTCLFVHGVAHICELKDDVLARRHGRRQLRSGSSSQERQQAHDAEHRALRFAGDDAVPVLRHTGSSTASARYSDDDDDDDDNDDDNDDDDDDDDDVDDDDRYTCIVVQATASPW